MSKTYLVLIPIDDMTVEQGSLEILFRQKRRVNDDAVVALFDHNPDTLSILTQYDCLINLKDGINLSHEQTKELYELLKSALGE